MSAPVLNPARDAGAALRQVRAARRAGRTRHVRVAAVLAAAVTAAFFVNILLGSYTVTIPDFLRILGGEQIPGATYIVMEGKLPRAVTGLMVGAAFGIAGTLFQTLLRNPLASPDIIGISYGASAAAVTALVFFGASGSTVSLAALLGALAVALAIYLLSRRGGAGGYRMILIGVGFAAVLQAVVSFLLTRTDVRTASEALVWLSGSLNAATWERAGLLAVALAVLVPAAGALSGRLRALELGNDTAAGLGVPVEPVRLGLVMTAVALAAVATAAAGPVIFVAFLSGPIAARLRGGAASLPAAALTGALIVLASEFAAANLLPATSLPVGVVTGALGAPFLLWLLMRTNKSGRG
ncbi:Ferric enterobactin transport system permease protein FepG [Arthrobacter saudimassiliensis]|uniref:Ferric enterobactin transport system permease protein FepG n=1 Tax=Arthrobacter saudimassiliensis TaxID=1461584 RepID=A0A078MPN0_9MICC|nr:Ferric enterobactin transport system permease protein FepG [Arthrobacter saudimassiliensis]